MTQTTVLQLNLCLHKIHSKYLKAENVNYTLEVDFETINRLVNHDY